MRSPRTTTAATTRRSLAGLFAGSLFLAACGSTADLDDLAETLQTTGGLTEEEATCVATAIGELDYSDDQINDLSDGEVTDEESDADNVALQQRFNDDLGNAVTTCAGS